MRCEEVRISRAQDFNNGEPGGREGFVIWRHGYSYSVMTYDLDKALECAKEALDDVTTA